MKISQVTSFPLTLSINIQPVEEAHYLNQMAPKSSRHPSSSNLNLIPPVETQSLLNDSEFTINYGADRNKKYGEDEEDEPTSE